jgi:hypothetical protein
MSAGTPLPAGSSAPATREPPRKRPRRRLAAACRRIIRSDTILVTVVAVAMTLSALSVYQATRASDEAGQLLDSSRVVHNEASRQGGFLQTLVDHDVEVLRVACDAAVRRDAARVSYLAPEPQLADLVATNLTLDAMRPLLLGDGAASCNPADADQPAYLLQRAQQRLENFLSGELTTHADAARLEAQAVDFATREAWLMAAGFLFAFVVAGIIAIDQLEARRVRPRALQTRRARRIQYGLLAIGAVAGVVALVLLVTRFVDGLLTAGILVALALLVAAQWLWIRRRHGSGPPPADRGRFRWWAEVLGALTLVAFTAAAVGLALVSIHEREATSRADREDAIALDLQRVGQLEALRDLSGLSFIAGLEAEEVTARQLSAAGLGSEDPGAIAELRRTFDERMQSADQDLRDQSWAELSATATPVCGKPAVPEASTAGELFDLLIPDRDAVMWHVLSQQQPAQACETVAAVSRMDGRAWSDLGSFLTVALVMLGLAGFLLALAASTDRSARSSRNLLLVGAAGTTLGIFLSLLPVQALVQGTGVPTGASARSFGREVAAGLSDVCTGRPHIDAALKVFGEYGPAVQGRAFARQCSGRVHDLPAVSSDVDEVAVRAIVTDLEEAIRLGPVTPLLTGDLGWYQILRGIQTEDQTAVRTGLQNTRSAIAELEAAPTGTDRGVHVLRFNAALALAALDDRTAALADYGEAVRCLDPAQSCPGGGVVDGEIEDTVRMGALADLELLERDPDADADSKLDAYRFTILGLPSNSTGATVPDRLQLDLFPQEVQVSTDSGGELPQVALVIYHRPAHGDSWAILPNPTNRTLHTGDHLNRSMPTGSPLAAGQYRADVYTAGQRIVLDATSETEAGLVRRLSQRLGLSVLAPESWQEWTDDGVEWHLGPDEATGITLRRVEGVVPPDIQPFLEAQLQEWPRAAADGQLGFGAGTFFLGLQDIAMARSGDDTALLAAGVGPYASSWACGGALFLARVTTDAQSPPVDRLFDSIVVERPVDRLPDVPNPVRAGGVTVEVPAAWDVALRPEGGTGDLVSAKDCGTLAANVLVNTQPYSGAVTEEVDRSLATYTRDFPGFTLENRSAVSVPGADEAELIAYTWLPDGRVDRLRQWQLYAIRGDTLTFATITTLEVEFDLYHDDVDLLLGSLQLTGDP